MKSGVYVITNNVTGQRYVGESRNVPKRWADHVYALERNRHHAKRLMVSFQEHGRGAFRFDIIEWCRSPSLSRREWHWMRELQPVLNSNRRGPRKVLRLSPDVIALLKVMAGEAMTEESIIEIAIRELAAARGVTVGQPTRKKKGGGK